MRAGLSCFFILCFHSLVAQGTDVGVAPLQPGHPIYLLDVSSTRVNSKPYAEIDGSPFINDNWLFARIKAEGREELIDSIAIKINAYANKVHFINFQGDEMQIALRIEEITIIDSSSKLYGAVFLSNFSQEGGFFRVIEDGGILKLLKKQRIYIWETRPLGMDPQRNFGIQEDLYLANSDVLYKPSKSCAVLREAFGNNDKVFDYISANKLSCNKEADLKKIVAFYTSLK